VDDCLGIMRSLQICFVGNVQRHEHLNDVKDINYYVFKG